MISAIALGAGAIVAAGHGRANKRHSPLAGHRVPVHNFTYPAGLYDEATIRALKRAGYRGAVTVAPGLAGRHHPFELKRIRIIQSMGVKGFAGELKSLGV